MQSVPLVYFAVVTHAGPQVFIEGNHSGSVAFPMVIADHFLLIWNYVNKMVSSLEEYFSTILTESAHENLSFAGNTWAFTLESLEINVSLFGSLLNMLLDDFVGIIFCWNNFIDYSSIPLVSHVIFKVHPDFFFYLYGIYFVPPIMSAIFGFVFFYYGLFFYST